MCLLIGKRYRLIWPVSPFSLFCAPRLILTVYNKAQILPPIGVLRSLNQFTVLIKPKHLSFFDGTIS